MAGTTSTTVTESIPIILSQAMISAVQTEVMLPLVFLETGLVGGAGLVVQVPGFATSTVADDYVEANDYATTFTLDTGSGASNITAGTIIKRVDIKDLAQMGSRENLTTVAGTILGQGLGLKRDADLTAYFSGFSQTAAGAGTVLGEDDLIAARNFLEKAFAPKPYNCVLHPDQYWSAKGIWALVKGAATGGGFMTSGSGTVGEEMNLNGFVSTALGLTFYVDSTINNNVGGLGDAAGGVFSREAIEYVAKAGINIEQQRDASAQLTELIGTITKGDGERRDTFGVYVLSDVA